MAHFLWENNMAMVKVPDVESGGPNTVSFR
jgi:hypothetical protein